jgi:hypothetical protein
MFKKLWYWIAAGFIAGSALLDDVEGMNLELDRSSMFAAPITGAGIGILIGGLRLLLNNDVRIHRDPLATCTAADDLHHDA